MATVTARQSQIDAAFPGQADASINTALTSLNNDLDTEASAVTVLETDKVLEANYTITAANLESNIASTAVTVLAAPGANLVNVPIAIFAQANFGTTAYDDVDLTFRYNGTTNALGILEEINSSGDEDWLVFCSPASTSAPLSATAVNKAIEVIASADPDGVSNGDGTIDVTILYRQIDLS